MSYIVFARKWRPQKFDEVVGQKHITSTLKNAIDLDRIAHAYLFSGPRGVGKTSTARILAKALNCEKGPTHIPCDKCVSCKEIISGKSMDVLEIDGASNRGIEEIRNLRENVKFMPSSGKYKIYIIDEVHMLTPEAFNALLKTLEEPPSHIKFIFATTRPEKVLPTILSRCQRFDFKKVTNSEIVEKLSFVSKKEKINIEKEALFTIARASDGSLRDAESTLDQLVNLHQKKINVKNVTKLLGVIPQDRMNDFVDNIKDNDTAGAIKLINDLANEGRDISKFTIDLCEHFRNILMSKLEEKDEKLLSLPKSYRKKIKKQSKAFSDQQLFYIINILLNIQSNMKYSSLPKIPLEIAVVKFAHRDEIVEFEDILKKIDRLEDLFKNADFKKTKKSVSKKEKHVKKNDKSVVEKKSNPSLKYKKNYETKIKDSEVSDNRSFYGKTSLDFTGLKQKWNSLVEGIKSKSMSLGTFLSEGELLNLKKNKITLGFYPKLNFHKEILKKNKNKKYIENILKECLNQNVQMEFEEIEENLEQQSLEKEKKDKDKKKESNLDNEMIKSAMDIFGGRVVVNEEIDNYEEK